MTEQPGAVLADAGYWHTRQIKTITDRGLDVLVPPDGAMREGNRPGWEDGLYDVMRRKLKRRAWPQALRAAQDHNRTHLPRLSGFSAGWPAVAPGVECGVSLGA